MCNGILLAEESIRADEKNQHGDCLTYTCLRFSRDLIVDGVSSMRLEDVLNSRDLCSDQAEDRHAIRQREPGKECLFVRWLRLD